MAFHSYFLSEILRVLKMYMSKQDSSISEVSMHVNKVTGSLQVVKRDTRFMISAISTQEIVFVGNIFTVKLNTKHNYQSKVLRHHCNSLTTVSHSLSFSWFNFKMHRQGFFRMHDGRSNHESPNDSCICPTFLNSGAENIAITYTRQEIQHKTTSRTMSSLSKFILDRFALISDQFQQTTWQTHYCQLSQMDYAEVSTQIHTGSLCYKYGRQGSSLKNL